MPPVFRYIYTMPPITIIANTISPVTPLRLSWRISHTKNATKGNKKTEKTIMDGILIFFNNPEDGKIESPKVVQK